MKLPFFKKADIIVYVLLVLLGAGSLLLLKSGPLGSTAVVSVDGEEAARITLTQEYQESIIDTKYGSNTLAIEGGTIWVKESDCRGGDCTHFAPISRGGQTIICLPHHLSITIEGGEDSPDAVLR